MNGEYMYFNTQNVFCVVSYTTCTPLTNPGNRIKNVFAVRDEEAHLSSQVTVERNIRKICVMSFP